MTPLLRHFQVPKKPTNVNGKKILAKFTVILDHFQIQQVKLVECPERGYLVWSPSAVRLSMEGREKILEAALKTYERVTSKTTISEG